MPESRASAIPMVRVGARRAAGTVIALALLLAQTGCVLLAGGAAVGGLTGAVIATSQPKPTTDVGAAVSVAFDPARDLTIEGGVAGDTAWVRGTRSAVGRVTRVRGDTLFLALAEVVGARGPATFPAVMGPTAVVVRGPGATVRLIARRPGVATATMLGVALGIFGVVAAIYIDCYLNGCYD
jgi:hypothetical protein